MSKIYRLWDPKRNCWVRSTMGTIKIGQIWVDLSAVKRTLKKYWRPAGIEYPSFPHQQLAGLPWDAPERRAAADEHSRLAREYNAEFTRQWNEARKLCPSRLAAVCGLQFVIDEIPDHEELVNKG